MHHFITLSLWPVLIANAVSLPTLNQKRALSKRTLPTNPFEGKIDTFFNNSEVWAMVKDDLTVINQLAEELRGIAATERIKEYVTATPSSSASSAPLSDDRVGSIFRELREKIGGEHFLTMTPQQLDEVRQLQDQVMSGTGVELIEVRGQHVVQAFDPEHIRAEGPEGGITQAAIKVVTSRAREVLGQLGEALIPTFIVLLLEGSVLSGPAKNQALRDSLVGEVNSNSSLVESRCQALDRAVSDINIVTGMFNLIGLDQLRNRLRNQFTSAYEITTNAVLESINSTVPHNWGSPARLPNIPSVEGLNADAQKIMQDAYDVELKMWEQTVLLRSIQIQAYLAGQYEKTIHVDAFELMKNDIAGRTYQGREEFAAAYAGVYSEYMIPAQCYQFINRTEESAFHPVQKMRLDGFKTKLEISQRQYFATRLQMPPTLPAPAVRLA